MTIEAWDLVVLGCPSAAWAAVTGVQCELVLRLLLGVKAVG